MYQQLMTTLVRYKARTSWLSMRITDRVYNKIVPVVTFIY